MADIPVVETSEMPLWAALLGLVAMAALIWILFSLAPDATPPATATAADAGIQVVTTDDTDIRPLSDR